VVHARRTSLLASRPRSGSVALISELTRRACARPWDGKGVFLRGELACQTCLGRGPFWFPRDENGRQIVVKLPGSKAH
jgi:hypothetical protein